MFLSRVRNKKVRKKRLGNIGLNKKDGSRIEEEIGNDAYINFFPYITAVRWLN